MTLPICSVHHQVIVENINIYSRKIRIQSAQVTQTRLFQVILIQTHQSIIQSQAKGIFIKVFQKIKKFNSEINLYVFEQKG